MNWEDIFYALLDLYTSWKEGNWVLIGSSLAMVLFKLFLEFLISPKPDLDEELGEPIGVASALLRTFNALLE